MKGFLRNEDGYAAPLEISDGFISIEIAASTSTCSPKARPCRLTGVTSFQLDM